MDLDTWDSVAFLNDLQRLRKRMRGLRSLREMYLLEIWGEYL